VGIIRISNPSSAIALNAEDVPMPWYQMNKTFKFLSTTDPETAFKKLVGLFQEMDVDGQSTYKTLVINCHGFGRQTKNYSSDEAPAYGYGLSLGTGILPGNEKLFQILNPVVSRIIITACGADGGTRRKSSSVQGGSGSFSLSSVAKYAEATVVGGKSTQHSQGGSGYLPFGYIDEWSGSVRTYGPDGKQTSGTRNGNQSTDD
jgi:hypothetical protein